MHLEISTVSDFCLSLLWLREDVSGDPCLD